MLREASGVLREASGRRPGGSGVLRPATFRKAGMWGEVGSPGKVAIAYELVNRFLVIFFALTFPEI